MPEDAPSWVVEAVGLTRVFPDAVAVRALDGVDVRIARGEFVAIMGPSGSGKSTLLHLVGALDRPTDGVIRVDGQDLAAVDDLDRFRARSIGFIFQMHNLLPTLTAAENVAVPMQGIGVPAATRRTRSLELLDSLGLAHLAHRLPNQLSGGQRQRVAVARALANDPSLILADEPTGNLDSTSGGEVVKRFQSLAHEHGKTIVLVTHDPVVALAAGRIISLRDGRIDQDEQVDEAYVNQLNALRPTPLGRLLFGERPVAGSEAEPDQPAQPAQPAQRRGS
ncbi:MAG: ABC transporter ATP-binding protein [Ardenticatenales bacterium]|nr:ABC transporter ATP-binding protein [Ardenticatenales bacterium]